MGVQWHPGEIFMVNAKGNHAVYSTPDELECVDRSHLFNEACADTGINSVQPYMIYFVGPVSMVHAELIPIQFQAAGREPEFIMIWV